MWVFIQRIMNSPERDHEKSYQAIKIIEIYYKYNGNGMAGVKNELREELSNVLTEKGMLLTL